MRNRFFRLATLQLGPLYFPAHGDTLALQEVLPAGVDASNLETDAGSIELFVSATLAAGPDILDQHPGITFVDTTGVGFEATGVPYPQALEPYRFKSVRSAKWKRLSAEEWALIFGPNRDPIGIALDRSLSVVEALGVVYDLVDRATRAVVHHVGRSPSSAVPTVPYIDPQTSVQEEIYGFKLIKWDLQAQPTYDSGAWGPMDLTWEYMYRNWYDLRAASIDPRTLEVWIERSDVMPHTVVDGRFGIPWLRVFGLDAQNEQGGAARHDGRIDTVGLVDYEQGLLVLPDVTPFDLPDAVLANRAHADTAGYTLPAQLRAPRLYRQRYTAEHPPEEDRHFEIVASYLAR